MMLPLGVSLAVEPLLYTGMRTALWARGENGSGERRYDGLLRTQGRCDSVSILARSEERALQYLR